MLLKTFQRHLEIRTAKSGWPMELRLCCAWRGENLPKTFQPPNFFIEEIPMKRSRSRRRAQRRGTRGRAHRIPRVCVFHVPTLLTPRPSLATDASLGVSASIFSLTPAPLSDQEDVPGTSPWSEDSHGLPWRWILHRRLLVSSTARRGRRSAGDNIVVFLGHDTATKLVAISHLFSY